MAELLVLNSGSSSLRYDVFDMADSVDGPLRRTTAGKIDGIGSANGRILHRAPGAEPREQPCAPTDHGVALTLALEALAASWPAGLVPAAVGHRVVHGGDRSAGAHLVDAGTEADIERLAVLAPLHNPSSLASIRTVRDRWPDAPQYAVFDTAFHRLLPAAASTYALPADLSQRHGIRRWGFHGISNQYVTRLSADALGVPVPKVRLIVCHIGNGVSVTAVSSGRSVETSMGFTPLEGAVMGSRSGNIDPALVPYLVRAAHLSVDDVEQLLVQGSGLTGLCGDSDMRRVRARADDGDPAAVLALEVYTHRLRGYIGAFLAHVADPHALVFTAGIGENDPALREEVVSPLAHLGLRLDRARNRDTVGPREPTRVDDGRGPVPVLVVPTDEALEIADKVRSALHGPVPQ